MTAYAGTAAATALPHRLRRRGRGRDRRAGRAHRGHPDLVQSLPATLAGHQAARRGGRPPRARGRTGGWRRPSSWPRRPVATGSSRCTATPPTSPSPTRATATSTASSVEVVDTSAVSRYTVTDRLDRVLTNRWLGLPIFFAVMFVVFKLVVEVSAYFLDWVDAVIGGPVTRWVTGLLTAVLGARLVRLAGGRWRHRRCRRGARVRPRAHRAVPVPDAARGLWLHGARGLRDGPRDALHRPARQVVHPHGPGLRLRRPGRLCHAHAGEPHAAHHDQPAGAADVVLGAPAGLRRLRPGLLRRRRRDRHHRPLRGRHPHRRARGHRALAHHPARAR